MKRQFVETLQEGDRINDYFLAVRKDLRDQRNGGKFLGLVFKDKTGEIGGILWNNATAVAKLFDLGDVVNVQGTVTSYQGRLQIRVDQVLPLRTGEFDLADLAYVPETLDKTLAEFTEIMRTVKNEWLARLINSFLDDEAFMGAFAEAAAGKKWHHAYTGGLAQHCLELAKLADAVCTIFPGVDRDILLTGILVHDIGKIEEMSHGMYVDYTTPGKLLGHLVIGADMVQERIRAIEGFPESLRLQVLHCILAHHGELVNGSPIVPKTVEAMVLHQIDNLGAQVDAFLRIVEETKLRGQDWSDYIGLIERPIWTKEGE
ncbi:MAG: 3'-5' exoribonuclease YhaM family protein [Candidatus Hydrogenedentales bacterium]|jgi:3'-5' exoribonuclease